MLDVESATIYAGWFGQLGAIGTVVEELGLCKILCKSSYPLQNTSLHLGRIGIVTSPYFKALEIAETTFAFSHLEPFTFSIDSRKAKKSLRVHVTFSNHCFTKRYALETHIVGEPILDQGTKRPRSFCRIRYALSLKLRELLKSLADPKADVWETTSRRNWAYSVKVDDPAGPYHIFFELKRAAKERRQWQELQLVVESAYPEDPAKRPPDVVGSMNFVLLCGKIYLGEKTSTRR